MAENWHKRHAISLACQLPDNAEDANLIIRALQDLVDSWLHVAPAPAPSKLLAIVREQA
jgi:hypothetical protein